MNDDLKIKFWGVRGSYPTPGANTLKVGGNTACVEIQAGSKTIILDAGTGMISLGRELARRAALEKRGIEALLLFSHLHHDHLQGFPFFVPAYLPNARLHIFGPGNSNEALKNVLEHNQSAEIFPVSLRDMASTKQIQTVQETQTIVWDEAGPRAVGANVRLSAEAVAIRIHKSYAHPGCVFVYRLTWRGKTVVYATDTEGYVGTDRKLAAFARDADVLIHDAQYSAEHYYGARAGFPATQGFGHSTPEMAGEVAASAEVGQLILFHHDPNYSDAMVAEQEDYAKKIFADSCAAREGLEIELNTIPDPLTVKIGRMAVQYAKHD
ncbi:MAG: MBL fold metallo-hydrolase [Anaerolineales bacterium]|nr:MBL fold metallo-hydrolase [Anaerolineales bacterium]